MSNYQQALNTILALLNDPAAFKNGSPQWKTVDEFDNYLKAKGYRITAAEKMGPSTLANGQQLIYEGPNNVIVKIKTRGYNDHGPKQRVGVGTMSIEATDGKGTKWENAIFKVDGQGKILAKSITAVNEEIVKLPPSHPDRASGQEWGVRNPKDGKIRGFTKFEVIQGGGGQANPKPINKQAWADASHLNLPKDFNPKGADGLASKLNGVRSPKPTPKLMDTNSPVVVKPPTNTQSKAEKSSAVGPQKAYVGGPVKPVVEHGLNPTPRTNAVKLGLKGVNWVIQGINDHIQGGRIEDRMQVLRPQIERTLAEKTDLGVLIITQFSQRQKMGVENESPLEHVKSFQYIEYEYGRTEEEAYQKFLNGPAKIRPAGAGTYVSQKQWIPPANPPSIQNLPTPFPKNAIATFVPGLEELVAVQFSHASGFDDKIKSRVALGKNHARFIIMFPPNNVAYFWGGRWRTEDIEMSLVKPGQIIDHEQSTYYVPTIDLDSFPNPYDATAAMVYPADDYTKDIFYKKGRIDDGGLLSKYAMEHVRFVKPHKIRLLEDFAQFNLPISEY